MMRRMHPRPFTCDATDDLELACAIERDAESLGADATLERYLPAIARPDAMPDALDAAIEAGIRAMHHREGLSPVESARRLAIRHPALEDAIFAVALGFGLSGSSAGPMEVGSIVLGRWRVVEILGTGATAQVVRARDELLSSGCAPVEVVIKRFADGIGGDARLHAFREMRALVAAPPGTASRIVALHAPRGGAASIVTIHEPSREMRIPDDLDAAVHAVRRLHRAGFSHGDLKPEHIRIRPDGSALLLDLGLTEPATAESRRRDLARLLEMAEINSRAPSRRSLVRAALVGRQDRVIAGALCLMSPRWRRRILARGCAAAIVVAAIASGLRAWRASLDRPDPFAVLAATGRLVDATADSRGRLIAVRLDLPEMGTLYPDAAGRPIATGPLRFNPDGSVTIFDVEGNPMSR